TSAAELLNRERDLVLRNLHLLRQVPHDEEVRLMKNEVIDRCTVGGRSDQRLLDHAWDSSDRKVEDSRSVHRNEVLLRVCRKPVSEASALDDQIAPARAVGMQRKPPRRRPIVWFCVDRRG